CRASFFRRRAPLFGPRERTVHERLFRIEPASLSQIASECFDDLAQRAVAHGGYRRGMSFHGAPVRITHKMPLRTSRVGVHGRPLPSSRTGSAGISGSKIAHCSSVSSIHEGQPHEAPDGNTLAECTAISI